MQWFSGIKIVGICSTRNKCLTTKRTEVSQTQININMYKTEFLYYTYIQPT